MQIVRSRCQQSRKSTKIQEGGLGSEYVHIHWWGLVSEVGVKPPLEETCRAGESLVPHRKAPISRSRVPKDFVSGCCLDLSSAVVFERAGWLQAACQASICTDRHDKLQCQERSSLKRRQITETRRPIFLLLDHR
jgi:hypothetical protein